MAAPLYVLLTLNNTYFIRVCALKSVTLSAIIFLDVFLDERNYKDSIIA